MIILFVSSREELVFQSLPQGNAVSEAKMDEIKQEISFAQEKNLDKKSYIISMPNDIGYEYLKDELSAEDTASITEISESRNILALELTAETSDLLDESANQAGDSREYGNGIVDLGYALKHYDEYAGNYTANQENTFENHSVLNTEDDVEYVKGMWGKDKHEELVNSAGVIYFTSEQMTLLNASARFSDENLLNLLAKGEL